jgi:2-oxo-4-hydroxy-4-carboxy--5-ureidoimidazoline (OHCU) decarboxylase
MHDLPRELSLEALSTLFEGRTRFVERLAVRLSKSAGGRDPFSEARALLRTLPEAEQIEALNAHPAIGARRLSAASAQEQGTDADPVVLAELDRLNRLYEAKFGFRFVAFVNRRSKAEVLGVLRARLARTREEELATALDELVAIAEDRHRRIQDGFNRR